MDFQNEVVIQEAPKMRYSVSLLVVLLLGCSGGGTNLPPSQPTGDAKDAADVVADNVETDRAVPRNDLVLPDLATDTVLTDIKADLPPTETVTDVEAAELPDYQTIPPDMMEELESPPPDAEPELTDTTEPPGDAEPELFDAVEPPEEVEPEPDVVPDETVPDAETPDKLEIIQPELPLIDITAPNFGYDFATDLNLATIEGIARDDVVSVAWETSGGASGEADGVQAWQIVDVPLLPGENTITVTGTTGGGETGSASIDVLSSPGVPFTGDLELSATMVVKNIPTEITASALFASTEDLVPDSVVLAYSIDVSTPGETLCSMEETVEGRFACTFIANFDSAGQWEVRAYATFGDTTWGTLPRVLKAVEKMQNSEKSAVVQLSIAAKEKFESSNPDVDPWGARDALADMLAGTEGVASVGISSEDGFGVWWITDQGIPMIYMANPPGTRGGGANPPEDKPKLSYPSSGKGALKGKTYTKRGPVGKIVLGMRADAVNATGNTAGYFFANYNDQFSPFDEVPDLAQ